MTRSSSSLHGTQDAALQFNGFIAPPDAETVSNVIDAGGIGPRAHCVISEAFSTIGAGMAGEVALDASSSADFSSGIYEVGRVKFGADATMPREVRGTVALHFNLAHVGDGSTLAPGLRWLRLRAICPPDVALAVGGSVTAESHR